MSEGKKDTNKKTEQTISKFISTVSDKNYADAHKYLRDAVQDKLIKRIDAASNKPLF